MELVNKATKAELAIPSTHYKFGDLLDDNCLIQIVSEPKRDQNTLDLVITNPPTIFPGVDIVPVISYHDIIHCEVDIIVHQRG